MELSEVIVNRRSIRHYINKEISNDTIKDILNHGILAPSAHNRQPWHFVIVHENKELKNIIADTLLNKMGDIGARTAECIKDSSALILVFAEIEDEVMDIQSVGACIENLILRAYDLGVSSLWIGYILEIEKELQQEFKTDKKLIAAVTLGYSEYNPKPRPRKTLEEVSNWY